VKKLKVKGLEGHPPAGDHQCPWYQA